MTRRPLPPSPSPGPGGSGHPRAPDLGAAEEALARRFGTLRRVGAPASLRARCLDAVGVAAGARAWDRPWRLASLGWAAALLLAVGVAALSGSAGAVGSTGEGPAPFERARALEVVDDPSVPLFHTVETFDRLTPAPLVAWQGGGR